MITNATVSVIGLVMMLAIAWGFYAVPGIHTKGRSLYALMLVFALLQLCGDGLLRALTDTEPTSIVMRGLHGVGIVYYVTWLTGLIGVLQIAFDIIYLRTHEKTGIGAWIAYHLPALILLNATVAVGDSLAGPLTKYMPLLYTMVLFFTTVWFYEKLDRGLKQGMIVAMIGCVLLYIANSLLHIIDLPLFLPVLLVLYAFSMQGRALSEEEAVRYTVVKEKESSETPAVPSEEPDPAHPIELSELEKMLIDNAGKEVERLQIDEEGEETEEAKGAEPASDDSPARMSGMTEVTASGMQFVEPSPMELLEAATVLTAETEDETEDAVMKLHQVDEMISDSLHNRPLILEKDLNDYYHRMKAAVEDKDYDTCLEILSDMSEYRISGIHLTRYERIRHAVVDEEWKEVENALKDY